MKEISYGREVSYQVMRTIRFIFLPIFILSVGVGTYYLYYVIIDGMKPIQMLLYKLVGLPLSEMVFENANSVAEFWHVYLKDSIKCIMGLSIAGISAAAGMPYNTTGDMPTFVIRHCRHCGGALENGKIYMCPSCGAKLPSGIKLAIIRSYGYFLSIVAMFIMGVILLFAFA